jgi:hypothetical protein
MGLDARDIPATAIEDVLNRIREGGFKVFVSDASPHHRDDVRVKRVLCSRGRDCIALHFATPDAAPAVIRIYIPNLSSWWPPAKKRRRQLQNDVTQILDSCGARFPGSAA